MYTQAGKKNTETRKEKKEKKKRLNGKYIWLLSPYKTVQILHKV